MTASVLLVPQCLRGLPALSVDTGDEIGVTLYLQPPLPPRIHHISNWESSKVVGKKGWYHRSYLKLCFWTKWKYYMDGRTPSPFSTLMGCKWCRLSMTRTYKAVYDTFLQTLPTWVHVECILMRSVLSRDETFQVTIAVSSNTAKLTRQNATPSRAAGKVGGTRKMKDEGDRLQAFKTRVTTWLMLVPQRTSRRYSKNLQSSVWRKRNSCVNSRHHMARASDSTPSVTRAKKIWVVCCIQCSLIRKHASDGLLFLFQLFQLLSASQHDEDKKTIQLTTFTLP